MVEAQTSRVQEAQIEVTNPITGEVVGAVPRHTAADVATAVALGQEAQPAWGVLPFGRRAQVIVRFHDLVLNRQDEIIDIIQSETGKSRRDAFAEAFVVAGTARHYAYNGGRYLRPRRCRSPIPLTSRAKVVYKPMGVIGIIAPWNYPFILTIAETIPALLAGNAVVLKPATLTPLSAIWGRERLIECGLPPDLLQVVTGSGQVVGDALIDHVDCIAFTGSTAIGCKVAARAAKRLIPFILELGGKNAAIVLADADPRQAANGVIDGAFGNCGQVCINLERVYVEAPVYDAFMARLVEGIQKLRLGSLPQYTTDVGSVISEEQLALIEEHVQDALDKGAQVVIGGRRRPDIGPLFYEPTVLADVTLEMRAAHEETFGPLLVVHRVASREEAIRLANDGEYGLHGGIWTRNLRQGEAVAKQIETGSMCVNDTTLLYLTFDAPMGGVKRSGIGRRHGSEGIRRFTQPQSIITNKLKRTLGSGETALAASQLFVNQMTLLMKLWRRIPFIR